MVRSFLAIMAIIQIVECTNPGTPGVYIPENLAIIEERDIIPEGTAYDPVTDQVFISCMYKRKIIAIRMDGSSYDFIKEAQDSIWAPIGMEVDVPNQKLWVISGKGQQGIVTRLKTADPTWEATLYCYDISAAALERIYHPVKSITEDFCFNDLTVSSKGDVYLTESLTNSIFLLQAGGDSIRLFMEPDGYSFLNGITLSPDEKKLFISSTESLLCITLETGSLRKLNYTPAIRPHPIDGLTFYDQSLIGHQSKVLNRFFLNEKMDSILWHETIDSIGLDGSTTGALGKDSWYYYIANSQIRSGLDYSKMRIMPWDSLEAVVIKRVKLLQGVRK